MKPLRCAVCIKPVPDPTRWSKLRLDPETLLLCRDEVPAVINPLDRNAIELARGLGGSVSVLTMAAPDAEEHLREALAMGCDQAFLLTDKAFAGADTLATAKVLAAALRKLGELDLILCGGYSLDGSTAQVGPQVAELLGLPDLPHVFKLEFKGSGLRCHCRTDSGHAIVEAELPALVTLDKGANQPRLASMIGIREASSKKLTVWSAKDLGLDPSQTGLRGSPTRMLGITIPDLKRKGDVLQGSPAQAAVELVTRLRKEKVLP
ncbi:MAG: electron transfer flavoprotein subunit beta/FixA family protein [Elusimicrobiota bacterium]